MENRSRQAISIVLMLALALTGVALPVNQSSAACQTSRIQLEFRDPRNIAATGITWEIFKEEINAEGNRYLGRSVRRGTVAPDGTAEFSFNPDLFPSLSGRGSNNFAIKVYDVNPDAGSIINWGNKITCAKSFSKVVYLQTLTVTVRDASGALVPNFRFQIYTQGNRADGSPIAGRLVTNGVATDTSGSKTVHLGHGTYVVRYPKRGSNEFLERKDVAINSARATNVTYRIPAVPVVTQGGALAQNEVVVMGITFEIVPHGSVVKAANSNKVYFIEKGKKRVIPNEATFFAYGFSWPEIHTISAHDLEHYPTIAPLPELPTINIANGTLVKSDQSPAVYLIENGKKRVFFNGYSFEILGFSYRDVKSTTTFVLDQYADGSVINVPVVASTNLVKAENASAIYRIEKGLKRPYANEEAFISDGHDWDEVRIVPFAEIRAIPLGSVIR